VRSLVLTFLITLSYFQGCSQPAFIENKGQWDNRILYQSEYANHAIFIEQDGFRLLDFDSAGWKELFQHGHLTENKRFKSKSQKEKLKYHVLKLKFVGAQANPSHVASDPLQWHRNYFIGKEQDHWKSGVRSFQTITVENLYPLIDLEYQITEHGMKYNFIVHSDGDPSQIRWKYEGANEIRNKNNRIEIETSVGSIIETIPEIYRETPEGKIKLEGRYTMENGLIGFLIDSYDPFSKTVIDPDLVFSTYAGNSVDNFGFTATYDEAGNLYAGGIATGPTLFLEGRFPATPGAFNISYNGGNDESEGLYAYYFECDIPLSKYSSDGSRLLYATYLGGVSNEYPHSIIVNKQNELIVFGTTFSPNYPTTPGSYQPLRGGKNDIIVTRFNADCSALLGSTYFGGSESDGLNQASILRYFYADDFRGEVQLDTVGNIYIGSCTFSNDLPLKNASIQTMNKGGQDGVLVKFNPELTDILWSTYFGGTSDDAIYNLDFDSKGTLYFSGGTKSTNLIGTSGAVQPSNKGGTCDGFISSAASGGGSIHRTSYWGTDKYDQIFGIEIDKENKVYVVGQTHGNMPVSSGVYSVRNSGQFITKFKNDLSASEWSTVWGTGDGSPDVTINAFLVDECKKIFVSGWGGGSSTKTFSSTRGLSITPNAVQKTTDGSDFYLMVLSKEAKSLVYATYFGGYRTHDHVDGGTSRFDKKGVIYQSVCASCPESNAENRISDFPTSKGAFAEKNYSPRCSNAAFKIAFGNLNNAPEPKDTFFEVTALDTIQFDYSCTDPDEDSLFVTYLPETGIINNLQFSKFDSGFVQVNSYFRFIADCQDVLKDTVEILVKVRDKGCPDYKDSSAVIRIKVNPPPPVPPPATICLNFQETHLKLSWESTTRSHYFQYLLLFKREPNGKITIIDTIYNQNEGTYDDYDVNNPKFNDYTYFLIAQNKCGLKGDTSILVSSSKEYEIPIEVSYVITATVEDNKNIKVVWTASTEADFGSYDVYRKINFEKPQFEYLTSVGSRFDTVYLDKDVNVQKTSYCYAIVVNDNCGHISKISNKGCTVVLSGEEKPFYFNLSWNPYEEWKGGVKDYLLERCVDTGSLRPLVLNNESTFFQKDDALDYDWGGYFYRIMASENVGSYDAISYSNTIYLIQPPLLHVPNAFTPNGDQLNEKWGIVPVFVKEYHLRIYDRWGEKVYETRDKHDIWSGYYKDKLTSNNVYIYQITFTGWDRSLHYRKGNVTILK